MYIQNINPFIRYANKSSFSPLDDYVYTYDCRLFYVIDGKCAIQIEDKKYGIEKGTVLLWQSGTRYRFTVGSQIKMVVLNFDYTQNHSAVASIISPVLDASYNENEIIERMEFSDCEVLNHPLILKNARFAENDLIQIADEYNTQKIFFREKASGIFKKVIIEIARHASVTSSNASDKIDIITEYIRNNYKHKIDNNGLGSLIGYHPYYLNRLMLMHTGTTFHQYLLNYRIECAKNYLANTEMSITEISAECGFASASYFSNSFKAKTGISPLKYRSTRKNLI